MIIISETVFPIQAIQIHNKKYSKPKKSYESILLQKIQVILREQPHKRYFKRITN